MPLHPEMPLIALLGLVHLPVARLLFVLGRGRGGDDGGIHNGTLAHQQTALGQHRGDLVEQRPGQLVALQPVAEVQHRRRVGHRVQRQIDAGKAAQGLAVVQRILQRFIRQPVPLLQEVDAQHPLQPDRLAPALALRIERLQTLYQPSPTAPPAPSRPETCRAASASSCAAYSACAKLPCRCIVPPLGPPGRTKFYQTQPPKSLLFQCFPNMRHRRCE